MDGENYSKYLSFRFFFLLYIQRSLGAQVKKINQSYRGVIFVWLKMFFVHITLKLLIFGLGNVWTSKPKMLNFYIDYIYNSCTVIFLHSLTITDVKYDICLNQYKNTQVWISETCPRQKKKTHFNFTKMKNVLEIL